MEKTSYKYEVIHNTLEDSPGVLAFRSYASLQAFHDQGIMPG